MFFRVFLASVLMLGQVRAMAQIEKLATTSEVVKFVHRVARDYDTVSSHLGFRWLSRTSFDSLARAFHLTTFEKADLDGNGTTDLIFNGSDYGYSGPGHRIPHPLSLAILSFGKDSFRIRDLSLDHFYDVAARLIRLDGKPYIQTIRLTQRRDDKGEYHNEYQIDTLTCVLNTFIEKRPPVKRKITQIDYTAANGLALWGITLTIIKDSVRLKKQRWEGRGGMDEGGVFLTRLDPAANQKLYGLLDAMDFATLKDRYSIDAYDATGGILRIVYDDGQTKLISDYGLCGTYGLSEIHQLFYDLPKTQHWVSADPKVPRCIDSLHSDAEVLGLMRTLDMDYPFLEYEPDTPFNVVHDYRELLKTFGQQKWQKGDIDGNGYTDLLFNGYLNRDGSSEQYSIIVFSFGGDSLLWHHISGANGFFAAKIIRYQGHDNVQINYLQAIADSTQPKGYHLTACEDTLTASDGQLLELPSPILHRIETARISAGGGFDSVILTRDTIYWYKKNADPPDFYEDSAVYKKDSISLYISTDQKMCQQLFSLIAGVRFERLNPELLMPNQFMRYFGSIWNVDYDGGKKSQFAFDGLLGSFRLSAVERYLWDLKRDRTSWKLMPRLNIDLILHK